MKKVYAIILVTLLLMSADSCSVLRRFELIHKADQHPSEHAEYHPSTARTGLSAADQQKREEAASSTITFTVETPQLKVEPEISSPEPIAEIDSDARLREQILEFARTKLGSRYAYSGTGPDRFDCSGFTFFVFRHFDITLPHSSRDQYTVGRQLGKGETLRPGDLVFFSGRKGGSTVGHVGIVTDYDPDQDSFHFIHAATSTGVEIMRSTAEYYASRYIGARRVVGE